MGNEGSSSGARWAADPSGRHAFRFWDGSGWTGHVADGAFAPARAPETTEAPSTPPVTKVAEPAPPSPIEAPVVIPESGASPGPTDERPQIRRRQRRQPVRRRWTFLLGALTGAGVLSAGIAIAVVALGVNVNTGTSTARRAKATTTTVAPTTSLATTTTSNPGRPPQQVRVEVINASALPNAAGTKAFALGRLGYQSAGLADAPVRQGTAVQCKPGFEAEAVTLSKAVGAGTTVEPFPNPPPAGSTNADCVVVLGK
jgi:Protein of unknown function (DUF2510)/LytR cell envelope-related transcriptional attenuator